jgi:hypothetical protein
MAAPNSVNMRFLFICLLYAIADGMVGADEALR